MKRLKIFILVFILAVSIPLAFVTWRTYQGLAQEEQSQLRFFSETFFDEMEQELALLVQREENRSVDEYSHFLASQESGSQPSPLARPPREVYIVGYLQNNPDGSFQTPLVDNLYRVPPEQRAKVDQLKDINRLFNQKKYTTAKPSPPFKPAPVQAEIPHEAEKSKTGLADRYLSRTQKSESKGYLGKKEIRMEEISASQARNLSRDEGTLQAAPSVARQMPQVASGQSIGADAALDAEQIQQEELAPPQRRITEDKSVDQAKPSDGFQVEVAPFQSVFITKTQVFIFRRIAIYNQIYRQGFILDLQPFFRYLAATHFSTEPLAGFMNLRFSVMEDGTAKSVLQSGPIVNAPRFVTQRRFPAPFDFFDAALLAETIPSSPARSPLDMALVLLGAVMLFGLLAIYQSARTVVDMSERRSAFVSSVTHELKTPLTNIRMYIEMLEQGIAVTPEREQEYLHILGAESARLSRLINNVLELAKLEKKQRRFQYREGRLQDVFDEVRAIMAPKLSQEGFGLDVRNPDMPSFAYDREVLIQILINLTENAVKFGKTSPQRHITISVEAQKEWVHIAVSDTGPGIPRHALKKVFDDFYRAENALTHAAGGTGIGLALVKKFVSAMGGRVQAANNDGPGCTITLQLPTGKQPLA
jgi:signal transduction histidine kinase